MARIPVRPLLAHHHEFEYGPADYGRVSAGIRRVSWGAIAAGAAVAVAVQMVLAALGAGIGIVTAEDGAWAGAWLLVGSLVAMFAGGMVTGNLAGMPRLGGGALHGLVAWAVAVLLGTTVLAAALLPPVGPVAENVFEAGADIAVAPTGPVDLSAIQAEARGLLLDDTTATGDGDALATAIDDALGGSTSPSDAQQDALVASLAAATDLTEAQARQTVGRWIVQVEDARGGGIETAPVDLDPAASSPGPALWSALALLLGALAAALGGATGTPGTLPATPTAPDPVEPGPPTA